jgi:predicted RecB family nuclease
MGCVAPIKGVVWHRMKITPDLFQACLKCPTKCWLRFTCEPLTGNPYAEWVQTENESYRTDSAKRLVANAPADECAPPLGSSRREEAHYSAENLKTAKWRFALDLPVRIELRSSRGNEAQASSPEISQSLLTSAATIETRLHAVERIPSAGRGKPAQFVPIRFVFRNKLTKDDRLLLAFDALVLSQVLGREVSLGEIIHGDDHATLKVRTSVLAGEVRKRLDKIAVLLSSPAPPDLVLNRHCAECEFQARCRQKALETDDLSLLAGMSAKERERHRSKGIFTVNQLSYTFRPRRTPKRTKYPAKPHYFALQALAIRENTVYIHGTPGFPECKSQVYLDIEGLPDRDSYYLIGALVVADAQETFHSFWADTLAEQTTIFSQLAESISGLPDFRVFHFGEYDTMALKKMAAFLPEVTRCGLEAMLQRSVNVLSLVHPHFYFPTYSSSLKEIGKRLGCENMKLETTGLQSIIWRTEWEAERNAEWKAKLVDYNRTDCLTLRKLTEFILSNTASANSSEENGAKVKHTDEIQKARPRWRMFAPKDYALDDLRHINKCGYFDYQREKVFVKTHKHFRTISDSRRKGKRCNLRPNKIIDLVPKKCPTCMAKNLQPATCRRRYSLNRLLKKPCFGKMTLNFIGKFAWNFGQNEFFSSLLTSDSQGPV